MAKLIKCRTCGQMIAKSAKTCPNCGAPNVPPLGMRLVSGLLAGFITLVLLLVLFENLDLGTPVDSGTTDSEKAPDAQAVETTEAETEPEKATPKDAASRVLYDQPLLKISFSKFSEVVSNNLSIVLEVENKSDRTVFFGLEELAVNDYTCQALGGTPAPVKPGEKAFATWALGFHQFNAAKIDDIHSVLFSVVMYDNDTMERLLQTARYQILPPP